MNPANASPPAPAAAPSLVETAAARRSSLIAAVFLMATSAIGPGFITQTASFTAQMGAAFGLRHPRLGADRLRRAAQHLAHRRGDAHAPSDIANAAIPGAGYLLAVLVIFGGLIFNIGNIAGSGLGLNALLGLDPKIGGAISALVAIGNLLLQARGRRGGPHHRGARPPDDRADALRRRHPRPRPSARRCARPSGPTRSTSPPSPRSSAARWAATSPMPARTASSTRARSASRNLGPSPAPPCRASP